MSEPEGPLFAFAFRHGTATLLQSYADIEREAATADFLWVHLDVDQASSRRWLEGKDLAPETVAAILDPVERGRLVASETALYGQLRDFRDLPDEDSFHVGALSIFVTAKLLVTARQLPMRSVQLLRDRIVAGKSRPASPFALLTAFFVTLNDVGEDLIEACSLRLTDIEADMLNREGRQHRETLLKMRKQGVQLSRDMAFKRASMIALVRERPPVFPEQEFRRFRHQVMRYEALVEDAHDFAEHCQFLLEEFRAQVAEDTNRNVYLLTLISAVFLPATLVAGLWGTNVSGIPFSVGPDGFWGVAAIVAGLLGGVMLILRVFRFF